MIPLDRDRDFLPAIKKIEDKINSILEILQNKEEVPEKKPQPKK